MQTEFLIIGQGLSGTWLSYFLEVENRSYLVIDDGSPLAPSRQAGGLLNPITGRHKVKTWLADELFPFAWKHYQEMGQLLGIEAIAHKNIIQFFANEEAKDQFEKRVPYAPEHLEIHKEDGNWSPFFSLGNPYGVIKPVYLAQLETLLPSWRNYLLQQGKLREEIFDHASLKLHEKHSKYKDIQFEKIIFCDSRSSLSLPYFAHFPFALTKGESLIIHLKDLPDTKVYKHKLTLLPLNEPGLWWAGSSTQWEYPHENPSEDYRIETMRELENWLRVPVELVEHRCSIRTGTKERRPLVGMDPDWPQVGILNGMGTKGCTLAPFFAYQLARKLLYDESIFEEADCAMIKKF
jgi:glycine/D-amino acid oxidase-like deaminating enzyme